MLKGETLVSADADTPLSVLKLRDLKEICEKRGFAEGNTTTPGDYVIERAFVES